MDGAKEYRFGRGRSAFSMFVVRIGETEVRGYLNLCPHFSLPLNHGPDQFVHLGHIRCVQHFAIFRPDDGVCVSGACEGSRLDPVGIGRTAEGMMVIQA
nr:Rieske 2Fe-2S domain-containing protein [Sphingomonas sp. PP-F2F-A104-K0414]